MKLSEDRKIGLTAGLIVAVTFCFTVAGVLALLWCLWTWVVPQICPSCPMAFTSPGYLLFCGMWFLLLIIIKLFRRQK